VITDPGEGEIHRSVKGQQTLGGIGDEGADALIVRDCSVA